MTDRYRTVCSPSWSTADRPDHHRFKATFDAVVTTRAEQPIDMGASQTHTVAATGAYEASEPRRASYL